MRLSQAPGRSGGYQQIFTNGIDRLPAKPCAGAVNRGIVADALPAARTADERGRITESVNNQFTFWCYVRTEDSTVSGEAKSGFATEEIWRQSCQGQRDGDPISVSVGEVRAIGLETRDGVCAVHSPTAGRLQGGENPLTDRERADYWRKPRTGRRPSPGADGLRLSTHQACIQGRQEQRGSGTSPLEFPESKPTNVVIPFRLIRVVAKDSHRKPTDFLLAHLEGRRAGRGRGIEASTTRRYTSRRTS